jgi:hypothetical protein
MVRLRATLPWFILSTIVGGVGCTSVLGTFEVQQSGPSGPDGGGTTPEAGGDALDAPAPFSVNVAKKGFGNGVVKSAPAGIDCGFTCTAPYAPGTSVTLTATPGPESTFTGWSGACTGTGPCVVKVDRTIDVTATFAFITYGLTVAKIGTGSGLVSSNPAGIDCGATCSANYRSGANVKLTASASAGSFFAGWSGGGCSGTGPCDVTMNAATTVRAEFAIPATWDPAWSLAGVTYSGGNLSISGNSPTATNVRATVGKSAGKWYWEIKATGGDGTTNSGGLGILESVTPKNVSYIGGAPTGLSFGYGCCGTTYFMSWAGATTNGNPPVGSTVKAGTIYMFALDMTAGLFWAGHNGTWYNGGNPAAGTNAAASGLSGTVYPGVTFYASSINSFTANFGGPVPNFAYPVPTGFAPGLY